MGCWLQCGKDWGLGCVAGKTGKIKGSGPTAGNNVGQRVQSIGVGGDSIAIIHINDSVRNARLLFSIKVFVHKYAPDDRSAIGQNSRTNLQSMTGGVTDKASDRWINAFCNGEISSRSPNCIGQQKCAIDEGERLVLRRERSLF